ncbi:MAG: CHRD domain-containing protein [Gaiellaceae bacterium]
MGCAIALTAALVAVLGTASAQASFVGINGGIALAYHANMDAQQMADAGTPGEPGATATAHLSLDSTAGQICYNISWSGIPDGVTFGHIHQALYGQPENLGFTVNLFGPYGGSGAPNPSSGCVLAPGQINAIEADPTAYIVVLHSPNFPVGDVRGQITPG